MPILPRVYKFSLREFPLRFNPFNDTKEIAVYEGLVKYKLGPAVLPKNYTYAKYNILILYSRGEGKNADRLLKIFNEGFDRIIPFGFADMFMLTDKVLYDKQEYDINNLDNTIKESLKGRDKENTVPIILIPERTPKAELESLYYRIKRTTMEEGFASQVITLRNVLENENVLKWSIISIFTQIFVKLGGLPYTLYKRSTIENTSEKETVIIIGLGLAKNPFVRGNIIGSSLVYDDRGHFKFLKFNAKIPLPNIETKDEYAAAIKDLLFKSYEESRKVMKDSFNDARKVSVVIHYRGKEISKIEEQEINNILSDFKSSKIDGGVYVMKLIESNYFLRDVNYSNGYPDIGSVYKILNDLFLIQTTGKIDTGINNKYISNIHHGVARSLLVNIRTYGNNASNIPKDVAINLLSTVIGMARLNYASISNPINRLPTTVTFSRRIAYALPRTYNSNYQANLSPILTERLWFI
jgi:hypothetical protein